MTTAPVKTSDMSGSKPILVFDSGLGGLTVLEQVRRARPDARYVIEWTRAQLDAAQLDFLASLPMQHQHHEARTGQSPVQDVESAVVRGNRQRVTWPACQPFDHRNFPSGARWRALTTNATNAQKYPIIG